MKEFRWENSKIGQGHYHCSLRNCINEAAKASLEFSEDIIIVEQFKPERKELVCFINGFEQI